MKISLSRKIRSGSNVFLAVALAVGCWVLAGWINMRHYHRFDWTAEKTYSLSDKTLTVLANIKEPLVITTLFRPGTVLEQNAKNLLEEYAGRGRTITVTHVDPDRDAAKVELLARRLKLDSFQINSVLFEMDGKTKQVSAGEMEEAEPSDNPFMPSQKLPKFKGEEAFTSAIMNLLQSRPPVIFFTSGHGERDLEGMDRAGISELAKYLRRENTVVKKLSTLESGDVPAEVDAVVIASPRKKFLPAETAKLDAYLKRGGKMLLLLDPMTETGLESMLASWGVAVDNDIVLDPVRRLFFAGPTMLIVDDFSAHPITKKLQNSAVILSLARSVGPAKDAKGDVQVLMGTSKEAWGETDLASKQAKFDADQDLQGPLSLGVALSRPVEFGKRAAGADAKAQTGQDTRLVVFGNGSFLTNAQWSSAGNLDLFNNSLNWLIHREKLISIGPKMSDVRQMTLNAGQMRLIFWFTVLGMPLGGVVAGIVVRYRRRR